MESRPSVLALVVLYRCSFSESSTISSILRAKSEGVEKFNLLIFDNSPNPISDQDKLFVDQNKNWIKYEHFPENASLAKLYNLGIDSRKDEDFFLILDQDSHFSSDFFNVFYESQKDNPEIDLFVPQVEYNQIVASPGKWNGFKGNYYSFVRAGKISSKGMTAIGSGMIISFRYLKGEFPGFDERFKLYGIDTFFMTKFSEKNRYLYILPFKMGHELSDFALEPLEMKVFRFEEFIRGSLLLTEENRLNRFKCLVFIGIKSLKLAIKSGELKFLKPLRLLF